jgi:hypothetical protein
MSLLTLKYIMVLEHVRCLSYEESALECEIICHEVETMKKSKIFLP